MNVTETLAYIHGRPKGGKKNSMARMAALLEQLGHPEAELPDTFHITGTNGKGSVSAMLSAIGQADGKRVGLFTSPYIVTFNDRFQINGKNISDEELVRLTARVKDAADRVQADSAGELIPTEFEIVTAIMFCYFAEEELDFAVIEVGIGGTYDSTNLLQSTSLSVITTVALDHEALLGDSLAAISRQKAGIIKFGKPVVIGPHLPKEALSVIAEVAAKQKAPVLTAKPVPFTTALQGAFQEDNLQTAVAAYTALYPETTPATIQAGLDKAFLPGRFENVADGIYLDGAHHPAGLAALQKTIDQNFDGPVIVALAGLADKHLVEGLAPLVKDQQIELVSVDYSGIPGRPALTKEDFEKAGWSLLTLPSIDQVLDYAKQKQQPLVFTGSLYFISDVRRHLCQTKKKF
ncbi:bifunctional folylpolyglutamate synthase/dihydrofolate synthase [Fructobacillus sp. W13]|uniref:Bifunctional folylpolyglutamate synthase/dihydrofolate synthase n=1 Tax=Fructobacillus apis TaxID=2935017 RepID=A0ABT0ZPD1_9LACO|nr:folylpolyglutamate synthase/dihydrofolate synthase family protein [Fructobacillus apis]MCO0831847.1 bifunctional folylpolyglutamate synthase/dihydrofolate synthase [Fructobacillus apis]